MPKFIELYVINDWLQKKVINISTVNMIEERYDGAELKGSILHFGEKEIFVRETPKQIMEMINDKR